MHLVNVSIPGQSIKKVIKIIELMDFKFYSNDKAGDDGNNDNESKNKEI